MTEIISLPTSLHAPRFNGGAVGGRGLGHFRIKYN